MAERTGYLVETVGSYCSVKPVSTSSKSKSAGRGARRPSESFSPKSQKALCRMMAALEPSPGSLNMTLTAPGSGPGAAVTAWQFKAKAKLLTDDIRKRYPGMYGPWRIEAQKRGAPHLHYRLSGCFGLWADYKRGWLSKLWSKQFDGAPGTQHEAVGFGVWMEPCRDADASGVYLTGEMAKTHQILQGRVGRHWGLVGRKNARWRDVKSVILPVELGDVLLDLISELNREGMKIARSAWDRWRARKWVLHPEPQDLVGFVLDTPF